MYWQPKYKVSGKLVNRHLTETEKAEWQKHPTTKNLFVFLPVPEPKKEIPVELKEFVPKNKSSKDERKRNFGGSGEPH